jgi:hypothetical protein
VKVPVFKKIYVLQRELKMLYLRMAKAFYKIYLFFLTAQTFEYLKYELIELSLGDVGESCIMFV